MNELERTVARLQAAEEIRALKARYAAVCDSGYTPDRMVPLFTKDAIWDGGKFGRYEGIDAMTAEDVADCVMWALTRPWHVNVDEIVIKALQQSSGARIVRRGE